VRGRGELSIPVAGCAELEGPLFVSSEYSSVLVSRYLRTPVFGVRGQPRSQPLSSLRKAQAGSPEADLLQPNAVVVGIGSMVLNRPCSLEAGKDDR
jgi:hypothetical protein